MFFNETNSNKVNTITLDNNVYFDETNKVNINDGDSNLWDPKDMREPSV
ncbi:12920_t:CDS:2 [Funneliformis caledonium]|uniref:12920_t:CDS:1 n=1 Tax=Funneliformis caledonium TaxID=1117310 RepID=A0A9N9FUQ2_9GLOM|nr:12920_t:CDS:2 [Funneliformis caledonium]